MKRKSHEQVPYEERKMKRVVKRKGVVKRAKVPRDKMFRGSQDKAR